MGVPLEAAALPFVDLVLAILSIGKSLEKVLQAFR